MKNIFQNDSIVQGECNIQPKSNLQEVDFAASSITITKGRSDVVEFMTPFWFEPFTLMIRIPEENTWSVYTKLFSVSWRNISRVLREKEE